MLKSEINELMYGACEKNLLIMPYRDIDTIWITSVIRYGIDIAMSSKCCIDSVLKLRHRPVTSPFSICTTVLRKCVASSVVHLYLSVVVQRTSDFLSEPVYLALRLSSSLIKFLLRFPAANNATAARVCKSISVLSCLVERHGIMADT